MYEGGVHCRFTVVPSTAANKSLGAGGGKSGNKINKTNKSALKNSSRLNTSINK